MAVYKGVELFGQFADDASTSAFPQWQTKGRIALKRHFPSSVKFVSKSDQDLTDELARQVAAASSVDTGRQLRLDHEEANVDAAGHLLLFLAEPLSSQVHSIKKGSKVWAFLEEQHDVWLHSRGAVLEDEKRTLAPLENESIGAYCRRAIQLQADLEHAKRTVADVSMVEAVLEGIERERPEWTVLLQGLQDSRGGKQLPTSSLTWSGLRSNSRKDCRLWAPCSCYESQRSRIADIGSTGTRGESGAAANTAKSNSQPAWPADKCPRDSAEGTTMSPLWILRSHSTGLPSSLRRSRHASI
jgi:hypothetical protein